MKKFFLEFKKFAMRGSVIDLAVGVVMGSAFGKITTSLVSDIIMPFISWITGSADFTDWKLVIQPATYDAEGVLLTAELAVRYGSLIQVILDFVIIAFVIFLLVKGVNVLRETSDETKKRIEVKKAKKLAKKQGVQYVEPAPAPAPEPVPSKEEVLLTEIRDLLKKEKTE